MTTGKSTARPCAARRRLVKGFIGRLAGVDAPKERLPGSLAAGLAALGQGVQIIRVHDVAETAQALAVWQAINAGGLPSDD